MASMTPTMKDKCLVMDSVATRYKKDIDEVNEAFNNFMEDVFYAVYTGSTVTIAGFGRFWMKDGSKIRFSRLTRQSDELNINVKNSAPDNLVYINNNNINDEWLWHNTVRTKHLDTDPLYMSIFVEANRRIYFKNLSLYYYCKNELVFIITQNYSKFYNNESFMKRMDELLFQRKKNMERLRIWIPRLLLILNKT